MFNPLLLVEWRKLSGRFTAIAWVVAVGFALAILIAHGGGQAVPSHELARHTHLMIAGR